MDPAPRKRFMECPGCGSPAVRVPWEPESVARRRRALWALGLFWLTSTVWGTLALLTGEPSWVLPLPLYALVSVVVGVAYYRSAHGYQCAGCNRRWRA